MRANVEMAIAVKRAKELDSLASRDWEARGNDIHAPDDADYQRGYDPSNYVAWNVRNPHDRAFIVESRTLLPQLVAEIERLHIELSPPFPWKPLYGFRCQYCGNEGKNESWEIEVAETKIGKRYICKVCGAGGMMNDHDAPISSNTSEWIPLSTLKTIKLPIPMSRSYNLAIRSHQHRPQLGMIYLDGGRTPPEWIWVDNEYGEFPSWATHFRFTDGEGVPILWPTE